MAMKVSKTIGTRPLPPDYYSLLGEILVEWAWAEYRFQEALWHLLGLTRKEGRALTSEMQVGGLTSALETLASRLIQDPTVREDVRNLAKRLNNKIARRNSIVHGAWAYDPVRQTATVHKYRGSPVSGKAQTWNVKALSNFLSELKADRVLLLQLLDRV